MIDEVVYFQCNGENRVSIPEVKSLGGIVLFFRDWAPGTAVTGGEQTLFMRHLSLSPVTNLGKTTQSPQSDFTPWTLTLGETLKSVVQPLLWWIGFLEQIDGWKFAYANSI